MASYNWNGGTGGWNTIANWAGGIPNSTTADATISNGGTYTVTLEAGKTDTADSVTLNNGSATLDVAGTLDLGGTLATMQLYSGLMELAGVVSGGTIDLNNSATFEALGGTLKTVVFNGGNSSNLNLDAHTLTLGNGSTERGYVYGGGTLNLTGTVDIGGLFLASGSELLVTGTAVEDQSYVRLNYDNGTAASILSIATTGTYDITAANTDIDYSGARGTIINSGLFENTGTAGSYFNQEENFTQTSTGRLSAVAGQSVSLIYGNDSLAGTINGSGGIFMGNGVTATLAAGLVLNPAALTFSDGGTQIILGGSRTISNNFTFRNGASLQLSGDTLTVNGSGALEAYIVGPGTVNIAGTFTDGDYQTSGVTELVSGTAIQDNTVILNYDGGTAASVVSITSAGTYDITQVNGYMGYNGPLGTVINSGLFEATEPGTVGSYFNVEENFTQSSTGTIYVAPNDDISLIYGNDSLAGTITGPGDIFLGNGVTATLAAGLVLNPSVLTISDGNGTQVILAGSRTIGNYLDLRNAASLQLGGNTLTVDGNGTLGAYLVGPGVLDVTGTYDNNGLYLGSGVTEILSGVEYQTAETRLDYDGGTAATVISITSTGTYDIVSDTTIDDYSGFDNYGTILVAGLFEKTGYSGATNVYAAFSLGAAGTLSIGRGLDISLLNNTTNDLAGTITGGGALYVGGNGGPTMLESSAVLGSLAALTVSDGSTQFILESSRTIAAGTAFTDQSSGDVLLNGTTLTLAGRAQFTNAYVSGAGELVITGTADINGLNVIGTATILDKGVITQDGYNELGTTNTAQVTLSIASGAIYNIINDTYINPQNSGPIVNAGLFEKTAASGVSDIYAVFTNTSTGTINAASGTLRLDNGGVIAGKLSGAGEIEFNGGPISLAVGTIGVAYVSLASTELVLETNVAETHTFSQSGGTLDLNGFNLSLGNAADYLANGYLLGAGTVSEAGRADINNYYLSAGAVLKDSGTFTQDGGLTLGTFGADTAQLTIASTGIYNIVNDTNIGSDGASLSVINNSGLFEKTAGTGLTNIYPIFNNAAGATLAVDHGEVQLDGGGTLGGTLTGSGTLYLNQYYASQTYTLASTAVVSVATLNLAGASLDITAARDFTGTFDESGGVLNLGGFALTLSAAAALDNSYLAGTGTLDLSAATELKNYYVVGGATLLDASTINADGNLQLGQAATDSGTLSITSGGTYNFLNDNYIYVSGTGVLVNAGLIEKTAANGLSYIEATIKNTGVIDVLRGTIDLVAGGTLSGTLEGAGTLELGGGAFVLQTAAVVSVATLEDYSSTLILAGNRALAGQFNQYYGGSTIALAGHTLTLSKGASLAGGASVAGAGTLAITGSADLNSYNLSGGAVLLDSGTITQDGNVQIGEAVADAATLSIASGAIYDILNDSYIYQNGTTALVNAGLLEKTGSGTSRTYLQGNVSNAASGTIKLATGILETQLLANNGIITIANGSLQADGGITGTGKFTLAGNATLSEAGGIAATQTVTLSGTNDAVQIGNATSFAAAITGFAAGDTIDLENTVANGFAYSGGKLTLTENGTAVSTLTVATVSGAGTFSLVQDGNSGTDVVLASPGSITQPNGSVTTDTWTVTSGDFNTAGDWSAGIPGSLSTATFPSSVGVATITDSGTNKIFSLNGQDSAAAFSQTTGTLTVIAGGSWAGALDQSGGTILDEAGLLQFVNGGTIAGTLAGAGLIQLGTNNGVVTTLATGAVISAATFGEGYGATIALAANVADAGTFDTNNYSTTELNGKTLSLTGTDNLQYGATFAGPGLLSLSGSTQLQNVTLNGGAALQLTGSLLADYYNLYIGNSATDTASATIATSGTYDATDTSYIYGQGAGSLVIDGLYEQTGDYGTVIVQSLNVTEASTGKIAATVGTIELATDAGTLAGTLAGNFIDLNGDALTIAAGAVLSVATLQINGGNTLTLGGARTYAGNFDMSGQSGGTLALGSFGLDLTGVAELGGEYVAGSGTLTIAGSADISGMELVGSETLLDAGIITLDGAFQLGQSATDTTVLTIAAGAVYDILNDNYIQQVGTATITNSGLFEKTADFGSSYIYPAFTNTGTGTLDVASGQLVLGNGGSLNGTIEGAGTLYLQNANAPDTTTLAGSAIVTVATLVANDTLVLENSRTFTGTLIDTNAIDLNSFNISVTGSAALDSYLQGPGTLSVNKADISGLYLYGDATLIDKGTVTQDGGFTMSNTGTDNTGLTIVSGAVYDLLTDNSINANGPATIVNAGLFEKTTDYGTSNIYPIFNNTGTLDVARGFLQFIDGGSLSGTVEGGTDGTISDGGIIESGGTLTIASAATISVTSIAVNGGDLSFGGNRAYAGSLSGTGGSISLNGHTISVTSPYLGGFYLTGPGTLDVSGTATLNGLGEISGVVLVDKGTIIQDGGYQIGYSATDASVLSIASGATFDIITDNYITANGTVGVVNAGLFEKTADNGYSGIQAGFINASTGTINVAYGTLAFQGGGTTLGGTLKGAGEIQLDTTNLTLTSTVVTVATLDIASDPTLGANLTYGGFFDLNGGDIFTLNSKALVLSGTAALVGGFQGPGSVTVSGSAVVQTLDLFGGTTLVDTGLINQIDDLRFSLNDQSSDTLSIAATGVYDILDDSNFHNYNNAGSAEVAINAGLLEKTGDTGLSDLQVTLNNTGTLLVSSGTLQVDAISNLAAGTLTGGTYVVDAGLNGPTLALAGTALVVDAAAITLSGAGTELLAGGTLIEQSLASIATGGILAVLGGRDFAAVNTLADSGLISLNGTLSAPALSIAAGGTLAGQGTVAGAITNNGLIDATGSTLVIDNAVAGAGGLLIGAGDELLLAAGAAAGENITFGGSHAVLGMVAPAAVLGTLVSLAPSDTIDLVSLAASSATITGGDLVITLSAGGTLRYALANAGTLDREAVISDGHGGTDIVTYRQATAGTIHPAAVNFGEHHAGVSLTQTYTIANNATIDPYSENLDGQMGATSGGVADSGSFSGLAPGHANSTALMATLVTSTAGLVSGTATVNLQTDGTGIGSDSGKTALPSETVTLTGTIFNYATASVAPDPVNFGEHHVGATVTQYLTLDNTAAPGAYSENLDARFASTSGGIKTSGAISELLAGKSSTASLLISLNTNAAGVASGATTLALTSDGKNIDSLGTTALASRTITTSGTLFNYATASAIAPNPVAFGEHHVGATLTQGLTLANVAAPGVYSENLTARFSGTSSDLTGGGGVGELAAGSTSASGLVITLHSGNAGVQSGTGTIALASDGAGIDTLGTTGLGSQTVTVSGTFFNYATAALAPTPIAFGEHHVGDTLSQALTVTNAAVAGAYSENLDISFSGTSSNLTGSGSIGELAAGASNGSALTISMNAGTAGTHSGTATLSPVSDGSTIDTLGTTSLAAQTVGVTSTLYNYATASTAAPINFGIVHVGQTISHYITIANRAATGAYSENLDTRFTGTTGSFTGTGASSELAAGKTSSSVLDVTLQTGTAGTFNGATTLGLTSDGSGIDTLGTTVLGAQTVALTGTVNNYATATIETLSGPGVLTGSGQTFELNLGAVAKGAAALVENLGILNSATGPADNLSGTFVVSGSRQIGHAGFGTFTAVGAGQADTAPTLTLSTGTVGTFTETIYLEGKGYNSSGYSGSLAHETLIVTGTVTAAGAVVAAVPATDAAVIPAAKPAMRFAAPVTSTPEPAAALVTGRAAAAQVPALHTIAATESGATWLGLAAARYAAGVAAVTPYAGAGNILWHAGALLGDAAAQPYHLPATLVNERATI